jgi:hypothetical protein
MLVLEGKSQVRLSLEEKILNASSNSQEKSTSNRTELNKPS